MPRWLTLTASCAALVVVCAGGCGFDGTGQRDSAAGGSPGGGTLGTSGTHRDIRTKLLSKNP